MARRRGEPFDPMTTTFQHSFRVELSCGHAWLKVPPVPQLGTTVACGPCQCDVTVRTLDLRELEVVCPTHGSIRKCHIYATITAGTIAARHNVTENKGKCHATVETVGTVETYAGDEPASDVRGTLRDEGQIHGSLF